jgi:hypothetical protein
MPVLVLLRLNSTTLPLSSHAETLAVFLTLTAAADYQDRLRTARSHSSVSENFCCCSFRIGAGNVKVEFPLARKSVEEMAEALVRIQRCQNASQKSQHKSTRMFEFQPCFC